MSHTSNSFYIDGLLVKKNAYDAFIEKLRININNLCQYLPQERVSEFTRMSPEELLVQTCLSLDKSVLLDKLSETKEIEHKLNEVTNKENVINTEKSNIKTFVDNIYKDIEKIKEKENKMLRIEMMETKKVWLEYEKMRSDYKRLTDSLKNLKSSLKANLSEAEKVKQEIEIIKQSPLNVEMIAKIKQFDHWDEQIKNRIEEFKQKKNKDVHFEADLENIEKRREKISQDIKQLTTEIENEIDDLVKERNFIKEKLQESKVVKIRTLERDGCKKKKIGNKDTVVENIMSHFVINNEGDVDINSHLVEYDNAELEEKENELFELKNKKNKLQDLCMEKKAKFDDLEEKKKKINEEGERRLELLKRYHLDTYHAVIWYRENKSLFSKEIIEPSFINLNIVNEKFRPEVEGFLGFTLMTSFICKDSKDFIKFMKKLKDEKGLRINAVEEIKNMEKSEYTSEKFRALGFDGCILDFIDVRKETKDFLIAHGHFDSIPVTKARLNERKIFDTTSIKRFAMDSKYFDIKRSRYNEKDYIVNTSSIVQKNLFSKKIDTSEIENQLRQLSMERERHSGELKSLYTEIDNLEKIIKTKSTEKTSHDTELGFIKTKVNLFNMNKNALAQKQKKIKSLKESNDLDIKKKEIEMNIEKNRQERFNIKNVFISILREEKYVELVQDCMLTYKDIRSEFKKLDFLENNYEILSKSVKELVNQIESQEEVKKKLQILINESKKRLVELDTKIPSKCDTPGTNLLSEQMRLLPNTIADLNLEIVKEKTQLKFINVSEESKEEYEIKKKQLERISTDLNEIHKYKQIYETKVKESRVFLIKHLEELKEKINVQFQKLFNQLGCEGRLEFVSRNGQQDLLCKQWKLNILVKFREKEKLEVLSSFRQSGGEKSVSTILFLLALQKIDNVPFRLVDEINQGMDKHNETSILNILFSMCRSEKSTQFFIISPKLVEGLLYNEMMKVIILLSDQPGAVKKAFLKDSG